MKATDSFTKIISDHLQQVASTDPLFAETLKKEKKSIEECITYILNTVQKSGRNGFADEEIFQMAVHYYDEDDIKAEKTPKVKVVVNHSLPASKEKPTRTIAKASTNEELAAPKAKKPVQKVTPVPNQISMF